MTSGRGATALAHLTLVWVTMAAAVPTLGFGLLVAGWGGGVGAAVAALALGGPLVVGLLAVVGTSARTVVPLCGSVPGRLGWAVVVFVLGTLGVLAGVAAYGGDVDLGPAATRIALTGVPYVLAAAFFVPSRGTRLGAAAVLAAGVVYGGLVGPAQARQQEHAAEAARYREHAELLHVTATPPGMRVVRAEVRPSSFTVEYHSVQHDGYVALTLRTPLTPAPRCPELEEQGVTCTVDADGEMRTVRHLPGGDSVLVLTRRHHDAEAELTSQTLDEPALRRLMSTLHPLSDAELEELMREEVITRGF